MVADLLVFLCFQRWSLLQCLNFVLKNVVLKDFEAYQPSQCYDLQVTCVGKSFDIGGLNFSEQKILRTALLGCSLDSILGNSLVIMGSH